MTDSIWVTCCHLIAVEDLSKSAQRRVTMIGQRVISQPKCDMMPARKSHSKLMDLLSPHIMSQYISLRELSLVKK